MGGSTTTIGMVLVAVTVVAGCLAPREAPPPPHPPQRPDEDAPVSVDPSSATPPPASAAPPAFLRDGGCSATLIRRKGLSDAADCLERVGALEALPSHTFACEVDADCRIVSAAGGCLGMNAGRGASIERLPTDCATGSCVASSFDDHRIRCESGCCLIYEE